MQFRYIGEEYSEIFGFKWMTNTVHDVTDERVIGKLSNAALFEKVDGDAPPMKKGDKGKPVAKKPAPEPDAE